MKKVSTLLLTGLLGTGMVFAGFSGTASLENTLVDLDNSTFGMKNNTEWDAEIELYSTTAEAVGEGDVYAEISATFSLTTSALDEETGSSDDAGYNESDNALVLEDVKLIADFDLKYANIVGDGWKLSISGVNGPVDYAADTIALDDDDDAYNYSVNGRTTAGLAVTVDELGTLSLGYEKGDFKALKDSDGYVSYETASLALSENLTAQASASVYLNNDALETDNNFEVAGSAKVDYVSADYSASVAADLGYDLENKFGMDALLSVAVAPLTIDAYYGTVNTNDDYDFDDTALTTDVEKLLNAKIVADLNDFDVPLTVTFTGLDLVNIQDLDVKAELAVNEALSAYVSGGYVLDTAVWSLGTGATYTTDVYTAAADVSYNKNKMLAASASIESTTLVDGATLKLAWADGDDLLHTTVYSSTAVAGTPQADLDLGSVTASCTIEF